MPVFELEGLALVKTILVGAAIVGVTIWQMRHKSVEAVGRALLWGIAAGAGVWVLLTCSIVVLGIAIGIEIIAGIIMFEACYKAYRSGHPY